MNYHPHFYQHAGDVVDRLLVGGFFVFIAFKKYKGKPLRPMFRIIACFTAALMILNSVYILLEWP